MHIFFLVRLLPIFNDLDIFQENFILTSKTLKVVLQHMCPQCSYKLCTCIKAPLGYLKAAHKEACNKTSCNLGNKDGFDTFHNELRDIYQKVKILCDKIESPILFREISTTMTLTRPRVENSDDKHLNSVLNIDVSSTNKSSAHVLTRKCKMTNIKSQVVEEFETSEISWLNRKVPCPSSRRRRFHKMFSLYENVLSKYSRRSLKLGKSVTKIAVRNASDTAGDSSDSSISSSIKEKTRNAYFNE